MVRKDLGKKTSILFGVLRCAKWKFHEIPEPWISPRSTTLLLGFSFSSLLTATARYAASGSGGRIKSRGDGRWLWWNAAIFRLGGNVPGWWQDVTSCYIIFSAPWGFLCRIPSGMETFTKQRPIYGIDMAQPNTSGSSGSCGGCPPSRRSAWNLKNPGAPADGHHVFCGAKLETHGTAEEKSSPMTRESENPSPDVGRTWKNPLEFYLSHQPSTIINQHHVEKASPAGFHLLGA